MTHWQRQMAERMTYLLAAMVFGIMTPGIYLLAPLAAWTNLCALSWVHENSSATFGEEMAQTIFVQPPISAFQQLALLMSLFLTTFIFIDMEFSIGITHSSHSLR